MRGYLRSELGEPLPLLAMDSAMPKAALPGASGGLNNKVATDDDDPNGNAISVANSPGEAAFMRLSQFLNDRLSPDDLQQALQLVQQLLGGNDDNGNGGGMAGDRRPGLQSYSQRFPNQGRLYRGTYR